MCDGSAVVSGHGEQQCVLNWLSELLNTKSQKWAKLQVSELNWRRRTFELPVGLWWPWCIETTSSYSWPRQYYSPPARWPRSAAEAGTAGARGSSPSSSLTTSRPPPPPSWPAPGGAHTSISSEANIWMWVQIRYLVSYLRLGHFSSKSSFINWWFEGSLL